MEDLDLEVKLCGFRGNKAYVVITCSADMEIKDFTQLEQVLEESNKFKLGKIDVWKLTLEFKGYREEPLDELLHMLRSSKDESLEVV